MVTKPLNIQKAGVKGLDETLSDFVKNLKEDEKFKDSISYIEEKDIEISNFIKEGKTDVVVPRNQLVVLRKWNSYTPLLPPKKEDFLGKGGGYFLRIEDTGIVIDPGYNFIENFLRAGYKLDDIDHVVISHAHNDHTVELEGILTMLYKRNKNSENPKKIALYMNLGSFKKFSGYFDLSNPPRNFYISEINLLNKHQIYLINKEKGQRDYSIRFLTTQVKHHEMITQDYALGFTFEISTKTGENRVIKFTCDTGWDSQNEEVNSDEQAHHSIDNIDILVAHIGSITQKEITYDHTKSLKDNAGKLYKHHLGLIGTIASIHFWKPNITLLSEFGEELNAVRNNVASKINQYLNKAVFATDLNFRIDLDTFNIMCFKDKKFYPSDQIDMHYAKDQLWPICTRNLTPVERAELKNLLGSTITVF